MNVKKLVSIMITVLVLIMTATAVSAQGSKEYYYSFTKYEVTNTTPSKFTYVEFNDLAPGIRQTINDITAENKGCKIIVDVQYKLGFNTPIDYDFMTEPQSIMIANSNSVGYLNQIITCNSSSLVFDWDTVLARANWNQRLGYVRQIELGFNTNVTITGIHVVVPDQSLYTDIELKDLSAGAPSYEISIPLV